MKPDIEPSRPSDASESQPHATAEASANGMEHAEGKGEGIVHRVGHELRHHAPFTLGGAVIGVALLAAIHYGRVPQRTSEVLFDIFHPAHVFFSAIVTAGLYRVYAKGRWWAVLLVGFVGSIGIGTVSDSILPYLGELLLGTHDEHVHAHAHIGFIDLWWLVNPLAIAGCLVAFARPITRLPHAIHVGLSTAASLFHMTMSMEHGVGILTVLGMVVILFLAVWLPCCTSDIVFPLLFVGKDKRPPCPTCARHGHG